MKKVFKSLLCLALCLLMLFTALPMQGFVAFATAEKPVKLTTTDGEVEVEDDWIKRFPYGTFAFQTTEATLSEGGEPVEIAVYRLGGTTGRATAFLRYNPMLTQKTEDEYGYALAVSTDDIAIEAEDASPVAQYQEIGQDPAPEKGSAALQTAEDGDDYIFSLDTAADGYQWQTTDGSKWQDVANATEETFVIAKADYESYDLRCVYTLGDVRYCTDSARGETYQKPEEEVLPEMPEDLELNPEPTFTALEPDPSDQYGAYDFSLTFADGEWQKAIRITPKEDDLPECMEYGGLAITDCEGASLYQTANTLTFSVADNDPAEPFALGLTETKITADKADGAAKITFARTGGNQEIVSVVYQTEDGTAVKGVDYEETTGEIPLYGDALEATIEIPLIDDGVHSDTPKEFSFMLTELKGDNENLCTLGETKVTVSLINSATGTGANLVTRLTDADAIDLSAATKESDESVVDISPDTVTGEQVVAEPVTAKISGMEAEETSGMLKSYSYGRINFYRGFNYVRSYWVDDHDVLAEKPEWQRQNVGNEHGYYQEPNGVSYRLYASDEAKYTMQLDPRIYDHFTATGEYQAVKTGSKKGLYSTAEFKAQADDPNHNVFDDKATYYTSENAFKNTLSDMKKKEVKSDSFTFNRDLPDTLKSAQVSIAVDKYKAGKDNPEISARFTSVKLRRKSFQNDLKLMIHTANDGEGTDVSTVPNDLKGTMAEMRPSTEVWKNPYANMKPQISLISGESGVTETGKLYVGSKISIKLSNTATFFPIAGENIPLVYLTDQNNNVVKTATEYNDEQKSCTMTMLWDDMDLSRQYTLNIVMVRRQQILIDFSTSFNKNNDKEFANAIKKFGADKKGNITLGFTKRTDDPPYFDNSKIKTGTTLSLSDSKAFSINGYELKSSNSLENLQWINFNCSPEEHILFNGVAYEGNQTIWLSTEDLARGTLTFRYYTKNAYETESIMKASIENVALYWDGDGNGRIDGSYSEETGYFNIDPNSDDEFVMFLEDHQDYIEPMFRWRKNKNGKQCQMFLKVYYTMNPRSFNQSKVGYAQVLPAFSPVGSENDEWWNDYSDEQKTLRYIVSGKINAKDYSSDGHLMYTAKASKVQFVDIPLGGDKHPAEGTVADDRMIYSWKPEYEGNLLFKFDRNKQPQPIAVPHSVVGDNFSLTPWYDANNQMNDTDLAQVNGYLGSLVANSTVALCVLEQKATTNKLKPEQVKDYESSVLLSNKAIEDPSYLQNIDSDLEADFSFDMRESGNPMEAFNMNAGMKIPKMTFSAFSMATVLADRDEIFVGVSVPLAGFNGDSNNFMNFSGPTDIWSTEPGSFADNGAKQFEDAKGVFRKKPRADPSYNSASSHTSCTFYKADATIAFYFALLFKYHATSNRFYMDKFCIGISAGAHVAYTARLEDLPWLYLFVNAGIDISITTGGYLKHKYTETKDPYVQSLDLDKNHTMVVEKVKHKTLGLHFRGRLELELFEDRACTKPVEKAQKGLVESDGEEGVYLAFLKQTAYEFKDNKSYYLRIGAVTDTQIDRISGVTEEKYKCWWNGFEINPIMYLEAGLGAGTEAAKIELFLNTTINALFYLGRDGKDCGVDSFSFAAALSLRVAWWMFSFKLDLIGYEVKYAEGSGWTKGLFYPGKESGAKKSRANAAAAYDTHLSLPDDATDTQTIYRQQEEEPQNSFLKSYQPTDTSVPFELSGYSTSSDAARLADGLLTGYDYKIYTVGDENYVLYHISRADETASTLDKSMLVLSKLVMTGVQPGLVNPLDPSSETPYISVDLQNDFTPDPSGDLDFHAEAQNVDGQDKLVITWISYANATQSTAEATLETMDNAVKNTVVKTAVFTPVPETAMEEDETGETPLHPAAPVAEHLTAAVNVSGNTGSGLSLPSAAGDAVIYVKSNHFEDSNEDHQIINDRSDRLSAYLQNTQADLGEEAISFRVDTQRGIWTTNGDSSDLCVSVKNSDGGYTVSSIALGDPANQLDPVRFSDVIIENVETAKIDDTYYVAYTTSESYYTDADGNKAASAAVIDNLVTIKRLYLRTFTVCEGEVIWGLDGKAVLLRTLYDYDQNATIQDGVYNGGTRVEMKDDPWFGNLRFLNAKLGDAVPEEEETEEETFELRRAPSKNNGEAEIEPEQFLLFDMNGSTYIIRQSSLISMTTVTVDESGKPVTTGKIIPFFKAETENDEKETAAANTGSADAEQSAASGSNPSIATGRSETVIGADSDGNLAAIYTTSIPNTSDNAICISKYEPDVGWGSESILAMHHLGVYEDNIVLERSAEDEKNAYLGLLEGEEKGSLDQFKFSNLQIAFSQNDESDNAISELLILTQGTMTYYKVNDDDKTSDKTAVLPVPNEQASGQYPAGLGLYAIGYGVGRQEIGNVKLDMPHPDFSAHAQPAATVAFTNTGDVSIRGSEDQPINVTLTAKTPTDDEIDLAEWEIKDNIIPGQEAKVDGQLFVPVRLPADTVLILKVEESENRVLNVGNRHYSGVSKPLYTVESKPELSIVENEIMMVDVNDDNNKTLLRVDFMARNLGLAEAKNTKAVFSYNTGTEDADGNTIWNRLEVNDSDFEITDESLLNKLRSNKSQGELSIGNLSSGQGVRVAGTLAVDGQYFCEPLTGNLELKIELVCAEGKKASVDETDDYVELNNTLTKTIRHQTAFRAPARISIPKGNMVRIPVGVEYSTADKTPKVSAMEQIDQTTGAHLESVEFVNATYSSGSGSGTLVLTPDSEGDGFVRLIDENTGGTFLITYTVTEAAEGLDIYENNEIFTFKNADGTTYDPSGNMDSQCWQFLDGVASWGQDSSKPYLGNLSAGEKDASFSFKTQASSIKLIFQGKVQVTSTLSNYTAQDSYIAYGGSGDAEGHYALIDFGPNPEQKAHIVTVKVLDTVSGYAKFDRVIEYFSEQKNPEPLSVSGTPPQVKFYVPETIYLKSTAGRAEDMYKDFQYYLNVDTSGAPRKPAKSGDPYYDNDGFIYFECKGATDIQSPTLDNSVTSYEIIRDTAADTSKSATFIVHSGKLRNLNGGNNGTALIRWTIRFKYNNTPYTATAYSVVYGPNRNVTADGVYGYDYNSKESCSSGLLWIEGAHITDTASVSLFDPDWGYGGSAYQTTGQYKMDPLGYGLNAAPDDVRPSAYAINGANFSGQTKSFRYCNCVRERKYDGDGDWVSHVDCNRTPAEITVDNSRFSNLNQVPNLKLGYMVTDWENTDMRRNWFVSDATDAVSWTGGRPHLITDQDGMDLTQHQYWKSDSRSYSIFRSARGTILGKSGGTPALNESTSRGRQENVYGTDRDTGVKYHNKISYQLGHTETKTMAFRGAVSGAKKKSWAMSTAMVFLKVNEVNKTNLRNLVNSCATINIHAAQYNNSTAWQNFESAFRTASEVLGNPKATKNEINNAVDALQYAKNHLGTGVARVYYKSTSGKTLRSRVDMSYNYGDTVTTAALTFPGYELTQATEPRITSNTYQAETVFTYLYAPQTYAIHYNLNGGTVQNGNPTSYTIETDAIRLHNPIRSGYIFVGWSGTGLTGYKNADVSIKKGSMGDRSYTANWATETEHHYGTPAWTWTQKYTRASATFTCATCGDVQTITDYSPDISQISAATCVADRVIDAAAAVSFDGRNYNDEKRSVSVPNTALGHDYRDPVWSIQKETVEKETITLDVANGNIILDPTGYRINTGGSHINKDNARTQYRITGTVSQKHGMLVIHDGETEAATYNVIFENLTAEDGNGISILGNNATVNLTLRGTNLITTSSGSVFRGSNDADALTVLRIATDGETNTRFITYQDAAVATQNVTMNKVGDYSIYCNGGEVRNYGLAHQHGLWQIIGEQANPDAFPFVQASCTGVFTCARCGNVETKTDNAPQQKDYPATCLKNRYSATVATVTVDGKTYSHEFDSVEVPGTALGHRYGAPTWSYFSLANYAIAAFTCERCGDLQNAVDRSPNVSQVSPPTCTKEKVISYNGTVTFDGRTYSGGSDAVSVPGTILGHNYGAPVWTAVEKYYNTVSLDVSDGSIVIYPNGYSVFTSQGVEVVEADCELTQYVITGTVNAKHGMLVIHDDETDEATYNIVFEDLTATEGNGICLFGENATVNLTLRGTNEITTHSGSVFRGSSASGAAATLNIATDGATNSRFIAGGGAGAATQNITMNKVGSYSIYSNGGEARDYRYAHEDGVLQIIGEQDNPNAFGIGRPADIARFTCDRCGDVQTKVDADLRRVETPATCLENRIVEYDASVTFQGQVYTDVYSREEIPGTALGHNYGAPIWTYSETEDAMIASFTCSYCGDVQTRVGSTPQYKVIPATCTENQYSVYETTVTFQGQEYTDSYGYEEVPDTAFGHNYGTPTYVWEQDGTNWTCTATRVCANDESHIETETVTATAVVTPPTCTTEGYTTCTAVFENEAFAAQTKNMDEVPAIGHSYGEPTYEWAQDGADWTCTATRICANDNSHVETETVTAAFEGLQPTCTQPGHGSYTAAFVNEAFAQQTKELNLDALGHDWNWIIDKAVSCLADGLKHEACSRCGETRNEDTVIPMVPHVLTWHPAKAPTCEFDGVIENWYCENCRRYFRDADAENRMTPNETVDPALGHDYKVTARTEATCTEEGSVTYTCTRDSSHTYTEIIAKKPHVDANGDGYCDVCGRNLAPGACKWCNKVHTGFFGKIVGFFHNIFWFIREWFK